MYPMAGPRSAAPRSDLYSVQAKLFAILIFRMAKYSCPRLRPCIYRGRLNGAPHRCLARPGFAFSTALADDVSELTGRDVAPQIRMNDIQ
jgi:hypothetical protein